MPPLAEVSITAGMRWGRRPPPPQTTYVRAYTWDINDVLDPDNPRMGLGFDVLFQGDFETDYDTKIPATITVTDFWLLVDTTGTYGVIDGSSVLAWVVNGVEVGTLQVSIDVDAELEHATGALTFTSDDTVSLVASFGEGATQLPLLTAGIRYTRTEAA